MCECSFRTDTLETSDLFQHCFKSTFIYLPLLFSYVGIPNAILMVVSLLDKPLSLLDHKGSCLKVWAKAMKYFEITNILTTCTSASTTKVSAFLKSPPPCLCIQIKSTKDQGITGYKLVPIFAHLFSKWPLVWYTVGGINFWVVGGSVWLHSKSQWSDKNPILMWHICDFFMWKKSSTWVTIMCSPRLDTYLICGHVAWIRMIRSVRTSTYHCDHHYPVSTPWQSNNGGQDQQLLCSVERWRNQLLTWYQESIQAKLEGIYQYWVV